jgi:hypothetical protein
MPLTSSTSVTIIIYGYRARCTQPGCRNRGARDPAPCRTLPSKWSLTFSQRLPDKLWKCENNAERH